MTVRVDGDVTMTRRRYLLIKACLAGAHWTIAHEAVSSTAIEHPEWDMEEERTWAEWERQ